MLKLCGVLIALSVAQALFDVRRVLADEPKTGAKATFRIARRGNAILLPIEVAHQRHYFLFDTGSTVTMFDVSLRPALGAPLRRARLNGEGEMELYRPPTITLGSCELNYLTEVVAGDFEGFRRALGEPMSGFLGMDVLSKMIVRIDCDRGELSILGSVPDDAGDLIPLSYVCGVPYAWVRLGSQPAALFLLDSGSVQLGSGDIDPVLFASLRAAGELKVVGSSRMRTILGDTRCEDAVASTLRMGRVNHRNLLFSAGTENALSLAFLSRYVVTFDFPNGAMYLAPGARVNEPDRRLLSGMRLVKADGKITVKSLDRGSPAAVAGLRPGDVLLTVDNAAVDLLPQLELGRLLATPGTHRLTIRRRDKTAEFTLTLRDPILAPEKLEVRSGVDGSNKVHK